MSINKRVTELRKSRGWSQQDFAAKIGVTRQTISNIENDKHSASSEIIMRILQKLKDLNPRWLILGEGDMVVSKNMAQEPLPEYESKYKDKLINSLERENKLLQQEIERLKKKS